MGSLSLCMIVKDAARDLERCLNSARDVVDEIVIVDTGSSDGTPEIANRFADRFAQFTWVDDFSAARNASLELASSQWILVLDADEELEAGARDLIRPAIECGDVAAYQLLLRHVTDQGLPFAEQYQFRLFRRSQEIRYTGIIHEQISESLLGYIEKTRSIAEQLPVAILHYGYQAGYNPRRSGRNCRLLRKALESHPDDPYYLNKLAGELEASAPEEARTLLEHSASRLLQLEDDQLRRSGYAIEVLAKEIQERERHDGAEAGLELCNEVIERLGEHPLLVFLSGCLFSKLNQTDKAIAALETGLSLEESSTVLYYDAPEVEWRSKVMLGELYYGRGFYNRAEKYFKEALERYPSHSSAKAYLIRIRALRGEVSEALRSAVEWQKQTGDEEAALLCGELLIGLGEIDTARSWLRRLQQEYRDRPSLLARVAHLTSLIEGSS